MMARLACWCFFITGLAPALTFADPDGWSYDGRLLRECDAAWFREILDSARFETYLSGELPPGQLSSEEYAKLALVESFLPDANRRVLDVVLLDSNPYAAAALYACMQGGGGDPDSAHYLFKQFSDRFEPGEAPELDAAFFAHIRDEASFKWSLSNEVIIRLPYREELNMYSAFAEKLRKRSQPYMYAEWLRLSTFRNNPKAKAAAKQGLLPLVESSAATEFSLLVNDIRELYRRAATKRTVILHQSEARLPAPYEHFRATLGHTDPPFVSVRLTEKGTKLIAERDALREGETMPLPAVEGRHYVLFFARLGNLPHRSDYCLFMVVPRDVWHWKERTDEPNKKAASQLRPDPRLFDPEYLAQFVGSYRWLGTKSLKVRLRGKKLVVKPWLTDEFDLVPHHDTVFSLGGTSSGTLEFRRDGNGSWSVELRGRFGEFTQHERVSDRD